MYMYGFGYFMDYWYIILVLPAMILSMWAQYRVKSTYKKFSAVPNSRNITGAYAAQAVLSYYGIHDVVIRPVKGNLTDNFNPQTKVISLSEGVFNGTSVAAVGIACHEAGHAAQNAEEYAPIRIRNAFVPVCNIGSMLGIPLALIGYVLGFGVLIYVGLILYSAIFVFHLITLPVEFNASRRAVKVIEETNLLYGDEFGNTEKVLKAAAMTYVASMVVALANLLRFIIRFTGNRRR